jgi:hypothetical protein
MVCAGLTKIVLERCQIEENPVPLLLTLPSLSCITIRTASRGSTEASLPALLPMRRPQHQLLMHPSATASRGRTIRSFAHRQAAAAPTGIAADEASGCFVNTSITSLSLVDVGLRQLPGCISQLVALEELQLALNHDMALNPATCVPHELTCLSGVSLRAAWVRGACAAHWSYPPLVYAASQSMVSYSMQKKPSCAHPYCYFLCTKSAKAWQQPQQPIGSALTCLCVHAVFAAAQVSSPCVWATAACTSCQLWWPP